LRYVISAALIVSGIIHLLPLSGVLGSARLTSLYGLPFDEPNLTLLMRHRAVLFGLVGILLIVAAFRPHLRVPAFAVGLVSVVSFLGLAATGGPYNTAIQRVVTADWVALVCLAVGIWGYALERRRASRNQ